MSDSPMVETGEATRFEVTAEGVAVITLHRPEARNAYTSAMGRELDAWYRHCDGDDRVRTVILTGTPPAFCAGADLGRGGDTFEKQDEQSFSAEALRFPAWRVRKPVVAAVNGHAIGLGFTLTLQCDLRIFAAEAKYGVVQVRRGVLGDAYSHWTLPRLVGQAHAADIMLTGRTFDGHRAHAYGLCNEVLPNDEVLPAALSLATDMAVNCAPLSMAASKSLLWRTWGLEPRTVVDLETAAHHVVMAEPDAREGVMAFMERRPPQWTGSVANTSLP